MNMREEINLNKKSIEPIVIEAFTNMDMYDSDDVIEIDESDNDLRIMYLSTRYSESGRGKTMYAFRIKKESLNRWWDGITVNPDHQNKGFGRQMVQAMEAICKQVGIKKLRTYKHLSESEGFWKKMKYVFVNEEYEKNI